MIREVNWDISDCGIRPAKWRAPTWSWASVDNGGVVDIGFADIADEKYEINASVVGIQPLSTATPHPMTSCVLTVRGPLITADLLQNAERDGSRPLSAGERYYPPVKGRKYDYLIEAECSKKAWRHEFRPDINLNITENEDGIRKESVFCLKLATIWEPGRETVVSLVLRRIDQSEQLYERIGRSLWANEYISAFGRWYDRPEETVVNIR